MDLEEQLTSMIIQPYYQLERLKKMEDISITQWTLGLEKHQIIYGYFQEQEIMKD